MEAVATKKNQLIYRLRAFQTSNSFKSEFESTANLILYKTLREMLYLLNL